MKTKSSLKYFPILVLVVFISIQSNNVLATSTLTSSGSVAGQTATIGPNVVNITDNGTTTVNLMKLYNGSSLLQSFSVSQSVLMNTPTTLNHNFGQVFTSTSNYHVNATYTSIGPVTQTNNYLASSTSNWDSSKLWAEKFTGLPVGKSVTDLFLYVTGIALGDRTTINNFATSSGVLNPNTFLAASKFTGIPVGYTISSVSLNVTDLGLGNIIVTNSHHDSSGNVNPPGHMIGEHFTGLIQGGIISAVQLIVDSGTANVRMKIYDDPPCDSAYPSSPINLLGEQLSSISSTGPISIPVTAVIPPSGCVFAVWEFDNNVNLKFSNTSVLPPIPIPPVSVTELHTFGTGPDPYGCNSCTTIANVAEASLIYHGVTPTVRVKIYQDDGSDGKPGTLLGQSGSITGLTLGTNYFPVVATVPASSNVWFGYEVGTNSLLSVKFKNTGNNVVFVHHVYGTGPDPFGSSTLTSAEPYSILTYHNSINPNVRVKLYDDSAGSPNNLIGQSGSVAVNSIGVKDFAVNGTIPGDGIVWGAFETDNNALALKYSSGQDLGSVKRVAHVYGTGPNPYGAATSDTIPYWSEIDLNQGSTTNNEIKGNILTLSPSYVPSYGGGGACGPAGCPMPTINYTFHRTADFKKLNIQLTESQIPFHIELLFVNGTFLQTHAWHNYTDVSSINLTANVLPNDNAYVAGYGSGLLFSFVSPGNASAIVNGIVAANGTLGNFIGVPAGVFFIVLAGSLANQRTGQQWAVILLAMIGIMPLIGFFTLDPKVWGACVITGMLALLLGKKIF